jgi:hypothetical protein
MERVARFASLALVTSALVLASVGVAAAADGPALLFAKGKGKLTDAEQRQIFAALDLAVASDGKSLVDTVCGQPASAVVELRDMNGDGRDEVLVIYGNSCVSGFTGSSVVLFIQDEGKKYQQNLGFPGASADPKAEKSKGYPDLVIGGPGFCFPVWRWNGTAYAFLRDEPQQPGGCDEARP